MKFMKTFGWVLISLGLVMISLPMISGFTGFFHTTYSAAVPSLKFNMNITMVVVGAAVMLIGLVIANPRKKTFLSEY